MFPLWQVSFQTYPCNGCSDFPANLHTRTWWMDMDIEMQLQCELLISEGIPRKDYCWKNVIYVLDVASMTQLNIKSGALRRLRRRILSQLPWRKRWMSQVSSVPLTPPCLYIIIFINFGKAYILPSWDWPKRDTHHKVDVSCFCTRHKTIIDSGSKDCFTCILNPSEPANPRVTNKLSFTTIVMFQHS